MRQIPRTVTEDGAKTPVEREGQYQEQLSALHSDINDFLNSFVSTEQSSEFLHDLHECIQNWLSDAAGFDRCKECDEFLPLTELEHESVCAWCNEKFEEEEAREYAASALAGDVYLGAGRYGRPRG